MLEKLTAWLVSLVVAVFDALTGFVVDVVVLLLDAVGAVLGAALGALPVPAFMSSGLGSLFAQIDPSILYFVGFLRMPECLAIFGAAYGFRFARKALTLFQW